MRAREHKGVSTKANADHNDLRSYYYGLNKSTR